MSEPRARIELATPSLPWKCSTTELSGRAYLGETTFEISTLVRRPANRDVQLLRVGFEPSERVQIVAVDPDLKVKVRSGRYSGISHETNKVSH
jgi:hypothetical protein